MILKRYIVAVSDLLIILLQLSFMQTLKCDSYSNRKHYHQPYHHLNHHHHNHQQKKFEANNSAPIYDVFLGNVIPSDVQITAFLKKGEKKVFFFECISDEITVSITACDSPLRWTITPPPRWKKQQPLPTEPPTDNNDSSTLTSSSEISYNLEYDVLTTHHFSNTANMVVGDKEGGESGKRFTFNMESLADSTLVHFYVSTEPGGAQMLRQNADIRLIRRQRRHSLIVKWNPSIVDPQSTEYCLVISTSRHWGSLCGAQSHLHTDTYKNNNSIDGSSTKPNPVLIACVGKRTHYKITNLHHKDRHQTYYLSLFATNLQSKFTVPYGRTLVTSSDLWKRDKTSSTSLTSSSSSSSPIQLKDGVPLAVNLNKHDGKAVFRYKVDRRGGRALDVLVVPCGGTVDVEICTKNGHALGRIQRIEGFGRLNVTNPTPSTRYYVKVFAMRSDDEWRRTAMVEVYATTKSVMQLPVPAMPHEIKVHEYESLRQCDSVTIGWLMVQPVVQPEDAARGTGIKKVGASVFYNYCVVVKEGSIRDTEQYRIPNQCGLENRLRKSADFAVKLCKDIKNDKNDQVAVETINKLEAGKKYIVQVTVKKPKGKTLSYDLLQVQTKSRCNNY